MSRPQISNLSISDCSEMEIKRDPENDCVDIICRGDDKFDRLRITIWTGEMKAPVVKIDQTLFDPKPEAPPPLPSALDPSIEALVKQSIEKELGK